MEEFNFNDPKKLLRILLSELIGYDEIIDIARDLSDEIEECHTTFEGKKFASVSQCIFECYKRIFNFQSTKWINAEGLNYEIKPGERPIAFERQVASGEYVPYKIFNADQLILSTKSAPQKPKAPVTVQKKDKEDNIALKNIIRLIKDGENVFITGHAGTGKSYILERLKEQFKKLVITSTTGIAAVNIKGQTIHSFAGIGLCRYSIENIVKNIMTKKPTIKRQIEKCKMLAIDEISMLNIRAFEYVDKVFRLVREDDAPFGGVQVIFLGDFFQLPPVETEDDAERNYCFESPVWEELKLKNVLLEENHRQNEEDFIRALSNMRINALNSDDVRLLNTRCASLNAETPDILHIFSTNKEADNYNEVMFNALNSKTFEFAAQDGVLRGSGYVYEDLSEREQTVLEIFDKTCRAEKLIKLKTGARVMLLINLDFRTGLVNGSCGKVLAISENKITVEFDNGTIRDIERETFEYYYNDKVIATREQFPLKLAYAVTIHKSQGMTLDRLYVDCKRIFERGQAYVAMSRVKTLSGLYLENFSKELVVADEKVVEFYKNLEIEPMVAGLPSVEMPVTVEDDEKTILSRWADKIAETIKAENRWMKVSDVADIMGVKTYTRFIEGKTSTTIAHIINRFLKKRGFKTVTVKPYYLKSIIWVAPPNLSDNDMPPELSSALAQSA